MMRVLQSVPKFSRSRIVYIPNCFTSIEAEFSRSLVLNDDASDLRVLLVSGVGPNKDFNSALRMMSALAKDSRLDKVEIDVVGFGDASERAMKLIADFGQAGMKLPEIRVHGLLPQEQLVRLFQASKVTWVHSRAEGFGRVVVEGRLAGRPVVMSRLPVFGALKDDWTYSYANDDVDEFCENMAAAIKLGGVSVPYSKIDRLKREARSGLFKLLN
ncbi:glycosyltransferase [Sphingomonas cavernae]|nr:glycosyltransferase [Sphingomonas cavernae]